MINIWLASGFACAKEANDHIIHEKMTNLFVERYENFETYKKMSPRIPLNNSKSFENTLHY